MMAASLRRLESTMILKAKSTLAGIFLLSAVASGQVDAAGFGESTLSTSKGSASSQTVFQPQTPKIVFEVELVDMPNGTVVRADWIAEDTQAAPPNYKIDSSEITASSLVNTATFSLSKPNAGWPVGKYRI